MSQVYAFLQPGWADWEAGYVLSGLRRNFQRTVSVATPDGRPALSIGGLEVSAQQRFAEVKPAAGDVLLLIGSDAWITYEARGLADILGSALAEGVTVGAICAATVPLARAGLLAGRAHTSNSADFLREHAPDYAGCELYVDRTTAIADRNLVTASGLAALAFAREVFRLAQSDDPRWADKYYEVFSREFRGS